MLSFLYVIFILSVVAQLFYFYIFSKFTFSKQEVTNIQRLKFSVIICARNEADNLKLHLEKVLTQRYLDFEVIVVNDASSDTTSALLEEYQIRFRHLKIIEIKASEDYSGNKKNAITKGVEAAKYEYLLFTDADCEPASTHWISEMASQFSDHKKIVLGYGAYKKISNSFLNKIIRYETLITAVQYFSYTKMDMPYMGVGRNLAYKKSLFTEVNGLESHANIKSGDDDLFINEVANQKNTTICFTKQSFTISEPNTTFKSWFNQKRRHITTANYYKPIHKALLGVYYISQLSFWLLTIILLAYALIGQLEIWNVILLMLLRLLIQYIIIGKAAEKLNEKDLIPWFPILDIYLVFIQFIIFIRNLKGKPNAW